MVADTVMKPEDIKQALIESLKDPEVTAILQEMLVAPAIDKAVTKAVAAANAAREEEIAQLKAELAQQKQANNDLEQYSRKNCLTISGLPDKANESVSQTVIELARVMGVDLLPTDIDVAHRLGPQGRSSARHIIVKFVRFEKREEMYGARKKIRDGQQSPNSPISADVPVYISDSLTRHNQEIMYVARQLKRKGKLFAAWSDAGKLKVRVRKEAPTSIIKSLDDLKKLVGDDPALTPPSAAAPDHEPESAPDSGRADASAPGDGFRDVPRRARGRGGGKRK